jgi:type VI secretion system secreted protein VgrG
VKIIAPDAQSDWSNGTITHQSTGKQVAKAAQIDIIGPAGAAPADVHLPHSTLHTDEYVVLRSMQSTRPIPNQRYKATFPDGKVVTGRTDERGRTSLLAAEMIGHVEIAYLYDDDKPA